MNARPRAPKDSSEDASKSAADVLESRAPEPLGGAQKRRLRGLAHALRPAVGVGKGGLGEGVLREIDAALEHHELIKVRLSAERAERKVWAREIADASGATLVAEIGSIAVLYRAAKDPERRRIEI